PHRPCRWRRRSEPSRASGLVPAQYAQRTQRVPAARRADGLAPREVERLDVCVVEQPGAVGLPLALDELDRVCDALVGCDAGAAQVVERAQDVVAVARGEGEGQERGQGDGARRAPAEEATLEQVRLAATARERELRARTDGALVLAEPFEHADGGVE